MGFLLFKSHNFCVLFQPNIDKLGTKVLEAKQIQIENKKKAKGMTSDYGTPSSISRASKLKVELIETKIILRGRTDKNKHFMAPI